MTASVLQSVETWLLIQPNAAGFWLGWKKGTDLLPSNRVMIKEKYLGKLLVSHYYLSYYYMTFLDILQAEHVLLYRHKHDTEESSQTN